MPKTLKIFFKFRRLLLGELCRAAIRSLTVNFEVLTGENLVPGVVVAVQTFGDHINFHPHLHLLVTEGGVDRAGIFRRLPRPADARLAALFGREVLKLLVDRGLISPEWAERILSWRHSGFNVQLEFIARIVSHIPNKGQVMVRYYGLYANAHRGKVRKASRIPALLGLIEEDPPPLPSRGRRR